MLKKSNITSQIAALKKQRNALILAHNYQRPEVQDIADHTGDSLELSLMASKAKESVIVFCGVRFMAETAAILCPKKTVLLPVVGAGCALADMATAERVKSLKKKYPKAAVITYVNTSAEVKAESHFCCTSGNAVRVRTSIGPKQSVIFLPDRNLGRYVRSLTTGQTILWDGFCPVHEMLTASDVRAAKRKHPNAQLIAHPECRQDVLELADYIGGTAGLLKYVHAKNSGNVFIVATELGLIHRLKKDNPGKAFYPASENLVCAAMKLISLVDIKNALEKMQFVVKIQNSIRARAEASITRMISLSTQQLNLQKG